MPKRQPPKNSTWVQLTKDFVKEWPEVLDGLQFQNMPVKYLQYIRIILKNNITIHYDIAKELKIKKQDVIARFLRQTLEANYRKIKNVDIKADCWFLDGFSPAKNPELWGKELLNDVYRCTANKGTLSTYSAAGVVRRNLSSAGFEVKRISGFGRKRHMTLAIKKS